LRVEGHSDTLSIFENKKKTRGRGKNVNYLFVGELNRTKTEGTKCHDKTMMSIKADKTIKENPSMCHLGRTQRDKDEGGV
jgi:hypothetical protein